MSNEILKGDLILIQYHGKIRFARAIEVARDKVFAKLEIGVWRRKEEINKLSDDEEQEGGETALS